MSPEHGMLIPMTTRKYEQRLRAEAAQQTRGRIFEALAQRLRTAPSEPPSLDKVAESAGVARSTIYTVFGSKAGLFDAFTTELWERNGLGELAAAVEVSDARQHLRLGIRAACNMFAGDIEIYRVLFSMARLDPRSVGGAVDAKERDRSGGMAYLAQRLTEQDALRPDVTPHEAADILWMLSSFEAFDLLHTHRGMSVDVAATVLADTAERTLCRPAIAKTSEEDVAGDR
jgi:AcrR family transcriptional regulator